jgi:hypothetical protein
MFITKREILQKKTKKRNGSEQDTPCYCVYIYILANMPVHCNGRKNYETFMRNDNVNGAYLLMFYPFIIYFTMTITSIM